MALLALVVLVGYLLWQDRQRVRSGLTVLPGEYWAGVARQDSQQGTP